MHNKIKRNYSELEDLFSAAAKPEDESRATDAGLPGSDRCRPLRRARTRIAGSLGCAFFCFLDGCAGTLSWRFQGRAAERDYGLGRPSVAELQ